MNQDLFLLAINLTQRCNLACAHCYLDAKTRCERDQDELTTSEVCALLDAVAARSRATLVVLTGGEPLLRKDLENLVAHGARLGLSMLVGSNGTALTETRVQSLKAAGLMGIGISVDSLDRERHDRFRGRPGSLQQTLTGIEACRDQGLSFQIHFTLTDATAHELPRMIEFAREKGARVLNIFFLVCTGRAQAMSTLTPQRYELVLEEIISAQAHNPDLIIRARCAPHFKRIAWQREPGSDLNRISGAEGDGCIAGIHYARVSPQGEVTACPYIESSVGNIRDQDFLALWDHAPGFKSLRAPQLNGRCGRCEFRLLCGGCRARPAAAGQSLFDSDPICAWQPRGGDVIQALQDTAKHITWSREAEQRLQGVPGFLRRMVRQRAETYVAECEENIVTTTHLANLMARRFGGNSPFPKRPSNHTLAAKLKARGGP